MKSQFISLPSDLEDFDFLIQDNIQVYNAEELENFKNRVDTIVPDICLQYPLKYIDLRMAFFAPDVIPLLKNIVEVFQMPPEKASRYEMKQLEIQAIELIKKIDQAFQQ